MQRNRPVVMSIAGMDPCGGAGLFADVKTFEQHRVYGLGVSTARTLQTESEFVSIRWENEEDIIMSVNHLLTHYQVRAVKIGIVQNVSSLNKMITAISALDSSIKIVVDPVIRSTTKFDFWEDNQNGQLLFETINKVALITPNYQEAAQLVPGANAKEAALKLSQHCPVLLKGGHNDEEPGVDFLYTKTKIEKIRPVAASVFPKHGSGCVLSASIAANLALGDELSTACQKAKSYTEQFLLSNATLLGFHVS